MFDIGFAELLLIAVVALLVLGPEKLPTAARTCGLWLGRLRRSVSSIQREINEELRVEELRRASAIQKEELDRELHEMRQPFQFDEADTGTRPGDSQETRPHQDSPDETPAALDPQPDQSASAEKKTPTHD